MLNEKVWSNLESSNWYEFIHRILKYSCEIAEKIVKNKSVLIHCSDDEGPSSVQARSASASHR